MVFITAIHIVTAFLIILAVLVQSGKGAEISASFSGSSQTVFGSSGGANFFVKFTYGAAVVFVVTSILLTKLGSESRRSLFEGTAVPAAPISRSSAPVAAGGSTGAAAPAVPADAKKTESAPAGQAAPAQPAGGAAGTPPAGSADIHPPASQR